MSSDSTKITISHPLLKKEIHLTCSQDPHRVAMLIIKYFESIAERKSHSGRSYPSGTLGVPMTRWHPPGPERTDERLDAWVKEFEGK